MAVEGENLGTATIYLTVDKSSMDATIGKAKLELAGMSAEASKQYDAMSAGQQKLAQNFVKQTEMLGKNRAEQIAYNAQLKIGGALGDEIAAKAIANANAISGAQQASTAAATAAADKFAVSAEERAAQEERFAAVMAAERAKAVEAEAARAAAAEARATDVSAADEAEFAAFSTTVRAKQALIAQLDLAMASGLTTQREVAAAEDALDAAMAGRALTQKEQVTYLAALDAAEARLTKQRLASAETINLETASLDANTAAIKLNSRTQYEIGVLGGEIASGNTSRIKRSIPALLNATGLTTKLLSPAGLGLIGGAASIGALVVSYVQAAKEADNFTRAIYATGQQSAITADQMEALAGKVGDSTGSYKSAAQALDLLVSSGKFTSDQYELLTRTLVNFKNLTGGSLQEGMQAIDSLNGQIGDGLVKLNSQYHFLTDTVYEQIAALQAQGKTEQARDLERKAFADGINQSTDDIKSHLDPLAKAWDAVGTAASSAWHKMGQDVREQANATITSIQTWFSDLGDVLDRLKHPMATVMNGGLSPREVSRDQTASSADANAQKEALDKQATQTLAEFGAESAKFRSAAQKRADEIVDVVNRTNAAIAKAMAAGNKDLADKIRASGASLAEAIAAHGAEKPKKPAKDNSDKLRQMGLDDIQKDIAEAGKEADAQARSAAEVKAFTDNLNAQLQTRKQVLDLQVQAVGMGSKEVQQQQELLQIQQQYEQKQAQLDREHADHARGMTDEAYAQESAALKAHYDADVALTKQHYQQMDAAQSNWVNGAIAAMQNWADQGANVADQVKGLFTDAFGQMNDALVNFVQTGKLNFSQLADSIIADLVRMELRVVESKILQSILGAFLGSYTGTSTGTMATSMDSNGTFFSFAKGGVFNSPSLSRYSGGVYDSPKLFKFASGGVFGEAGPEAIMPLSRGSDGKLGVKATGGGGNTTVIVENHSDSKAQVQQSKDSNGGDIIKVIVGQAVSEVDKRIARGGSTGQMIQQVFGLNRRGVPVAG